VPAVFFITHPDVRIDPKVPVPEWPLDERGRARMRAMATHRWVRGIRRIFCSGERKARDGAQILTDELGLGGYSVVDDLAENDRTATGYLPKLEFEATVDAFFAEPLISVRGWESAADAQTRIIQAVEQAVSQASDTGDVAIIGHGGTGTLLYCHLAGLSISRRHEQPPTNGGNWFAFDSARQKLLHRGWRSIDAPTFEEAAEIVIETARLRIRSTRDDDPADLVALIDNWEVARWVSSVPHPYTEADGRKWIALVQQDHATGQARRFIIASRKTDRLIGGVGLDGSSGDDSDEPSLGYWLGQPYWGNGYGREAVAAVIDYGFRALGLRTIRAYTDPSNAASQKVLLHCGLKHVGEIELIKATRHGALRAPLYRISRLELAS
jgi:RimJ/RimL family protein N-acetyltransferase